MSDRGCSLTAQVIRLRSIGEYEAAEDLERVQVRNNHSPDPTVMFRKYGVLI